MNPKQRSGDIKPGEVPGGDAQARGGRFSGDHPSQNKERESFSRLLAPLKTAPTPPNPTHVVLFCVSFWWCEAGMCEEVVLWEMEGDSYFTSSRSNSGAKSPELSPFTTEQVAVY